MMPNSSLHPDRNKCARAAEVCACFNFRKASRAVTQLFDEALQEAGLRSTQFVVLVAIYLNEPINSATLSRALVLDRSTLSRHLKNLKQRGLVRFQTRQNQQSHKINLTAKGRQRIVKALPLWEKAQNQFVSQFGPEKWTTMLRGLQQAIDATQLD